MSYDRVLKKIVRALDRAGIGYMLTGSFASVVYGALRSTQDIDFVIEATEAQLRPLLEGLSAEEYYFDPEAALEALRRESMFNVIDKEDSWKIDLIFRKSRPFSKEEFNRRQLTQMLGVSLFVATAEDIIIAKLEWAKLGHSRRQIEDASGIIRLRGETLDKSYVNKWVQELGLNEQWHHALQSIDKA